MANAICHFLEVRGIRVWIAPRDILLGLEWSEAIVDAISSSSILVLVFSSFANKLAQVKREVDMKIFPFTQIDLQSCQESPDGSGRLPILPGTPCLQSADSRQGHPGGDSEYGVC